MTVRVNRFETSFSSNILHHTYGIFCDKCFKNGNTKSFLRHNLWYTILSEYKKYMVLFSPDFKYKVDSFNLYIIDNYVKRTIGRCIPRID